MIKTILSQYFNFSSLKTGFNVNINPTCPRYTPHILHGHSSGTHVLILDLKALRVSDCFVSLGTKSHIFETR